MSSLPPSPTPAAAPPPAAPASVRPARSRPGLFVLLALALVLALGGGGWALLQLKRSNDGLAERVTRAEAEAATAVASAEQRARSAQVALDKLQDDVDRLQNQRGELDQLYLDLTRGRDEAALVEVERLIAVAAQELQVSGNVATATAALQAVDARLARLDRPQLVNLRRAIARDLERLRAAPALDVTGLAVKLDQMIAAVDGMPLLAEPARPPAKSAEAKTTSASATPGTTGSTPAPVNDWWSRARAWLSEEFGDLVRIRAVDTPEALLLNEQQQRLARQQLRLRLLNARQSLLLRNDRLYRADLAEAQALLARYFDVRQPAVAAAATQLKAMEKAPLSVEVPQITESLGALQAARSGRTPTSGR